MLKQYFVSNHTDWLSCIYLTLKKPANLCHWSSQTSMEKKNPFITVPICFPFTFRFPPLFFKFWVTTSHRIVHQKITSCLTFSPFWEHRCHVHHSSFLLAYTLTPVKSKHHKCCLPALCLTARLISSRHLITHVNPMEGWHRALLFLSRLKEQVVGRGMNALYVPQISIGMNIFFNFPPNPTALHSLLCWFSIFRCALHTWFCQLIVLQVSGQYSVSTESCHLILKKIKYPKSLLVLSLF